MRMTVEYTESLVHPTADVSDYAHIGEGTKIYQNVVVTSAAKIGKHCSIGAGAFIDGKVGDYCKISNGVCVWQGVQLEDNVFVSHGVSFINVTIPRTYKSIPREMYKQTFIRSGATLEPNCTIAPVEVGKGAIVGMGSVVLEDIPAKTFVHGNPATISLKSFKNKLNNKQRTYVEEER